MFKARIKSTGEIITIDDFITDHGLAAIYRGLEIVCPACDGRLYPYGMTSLNVKRSLNHYPGTSCVVDIYWNDGLLPPSDWDIANGKRMRELLESKEYISKLYCFCLALCGKETLSIEKFCSLVKKADQRKLWRAKGLEEWLIGFILLVLDKFEGLSKKGQKYEFRFYLKKKVGRINSTKITNKSEDISIEDLYQTDKYYLYKVFDLSAKLMSFPDGNPYQVNKETWERFLKNAKWIETTLGKSLVLKMIKLGINK